MTALPSSTFVETRRAATDGAVARKRMDAAKAAQLLDLVRPTARFADLDGCDLIIEAVFENRELKAKVTQEAEPMLAPGGFFASNPRSATGSPPMARRGRPAGAASRPRPGAIAFMSR